MVVTASRVEAIDLSVVRPERVGVIIYKKTKLGTIFGMGIDTKFLDITDFGGRMEKKDKSALDGALREFREETLGMFGPISEIGSCLALYDKRNMIVFVPVTQCPRAICSEFDRRFDLVTRETRKNPEVSAIKWLTQKDMRNAIYRKSRMFGRVKRFLAEADKRYRIF